MADARLRVADTGPLRRRRPAVLFRAILVLPHLAILFAWILVVLAALPVSWLVTLFRGRVPTALYDFSAACLRYQGQVIAWLDLLSGRSPNARRTRAHPFTIDVPAPQPQGRLTTLLRLPLAVPAIVLSSVFAVILTAVAIGSWFVALVRGRTTPGLQELGSFCLRYQLETQAYLWLLQPAYPRLAPPPAPTAARE